MEYVSQYTGIYYSKFNKGHNLSGMLLILCMVQDCGTVNWEIFARILFLQIAIKDNFSTLKICDKGMITSGCIHHLTKE